MKYLEFVWDSASWPTLQSNGDCFFLSLFFSCSARASRVFSRLTALFGSHVAVTTSSIRSVRSICGYSLPSSCRQKAFSATKLRFIVAWSSCKEQLPPRAKESTRIVLNTWMMAAQYLRARKQATPALIHFDWAWLEGSSRSRTKLVEWPVVESVPLRESTL